MDELVQYRMRIGIFLAITSKPSRKQKPTLPFKTMTHIPKSRSTRLVRNKTEYKDVLKEQKSINGLTFLVVFYVCLHLITIIEHQQSDDIRRSLMCKRFGFPNSMYDNVSYYQLSSSHGIGGFNFVSLRYSMPFCHVDKDYNESLACMNSDVKNNINDQCHNNYIIFTYYNILENGFQSPRYINFGHLYFFHLSILHRSGGKETLASHSGTADYLLGNKGMHAYNGNPPTGEPFQHGTKRRPEYMLKTLQAWRKEDIYMTKGITAVKEKISNKDCVCVIGVPGAGKSTALHHAAISLEIEGFIIYSITRIDQFLTYCDTTEKQVFVVDNALGVYSVAQDEVNVWQEHNEHIKNALNKNTKLLVSVRTQIYMHENIKHRNILFLDKSTTDYVDFSSMDYKLGKDEMKGMLKHHMVAEGVGDDDISKVIRRLWPYSEEGLVRMNEEDKQFFKSQYTAGVEFAECFPLLCKVFVNEDSARQNPQAFFKNPFAALIQVFNNIKSDNNHCFCALMLCALFDGRLNEDMFSELCEHVKQLDIKDIKLRNVIIKSCKLERSKDLTQIKEALLSLTGVYITQIGNTFRMSHAIFHDIVTYLYDDKTFIFEYGTSDFIRDRVRINSGPPNDPYIIVIHDDTNIKRLVDRLIKDLKLHKEIGAKFIANNPNIDDERLIFYLRSKLFHSEQIDRKLIDSIFSQCMKTVWWNRGNYINGEVTQTKLIELCIQTGVDCNMDIGGWLYPIHISVMSGSVQLTELLLHNGADKRRVTWSYSSVLHKLSKFTKYNKLELFKLLTRQEEQCVVKFITRDRIAMSKELQHSDKNLQLEEVFFDNSIKVLPKHEIDIMNYRGEIQLVERLHDNILTFTGTRKTNVFHWFTDNIDITKHLLGLPRIRGLINQRDKDGKTPFWYVSNKTNPEKYELGVEISDKDSQAMIKLYKDNNAEL